MVALFKNGLNISKIGISFELLPFAIVTENIFLIKCINLFLLLFPFHRISSCAVGGQTDIHIDRQTDRQTDRQRDEVLTL